MKLKENAPYDVIFVGRAMRTIPRVFLYDLLAENGRMVIPIGTAEKQTLTVVDSDKDGSVNIETVCDVRLPMYDDLGTVGSQTITE